MRRVQFVTVKRDMFVVLTYHCSKLIVAGVHMYFKWAQKSGYARSVSLQIIFVSFGTICRVFLSIPTALSHLGVPGVVLKLLIVFATCCGSNLS